MRRARRLVRLAAGWTLALGACALGCGARSGVEVEPVERPDLDAGVRDGGPRDGGIGAPDVRPSSCPPPSDFGYGVVPLGVLDLPEAVDEISLGGDGSDVYLGARAARAAGSVSLVALDPSLRTAREIFVVEDARVPRVSVVAGVARLTATASLTGDHVLVEARAGVAREIGRTTIFRGPLLTVCRPAWNGERLVVAGSNGSELFLGAFLPGTTSVAWRSFGPASGVEAAAQPATGITELLYRAGDGSLRVETFAADGAVLWPPSGTVLEDIGFVGRVAFGWLDADGTDQPLALAGFALGPEGPRPTLRRFRSDGAAAGGFSAPPAGAMPGGVDLTTVAPPGHRHGYGMVAGRLGAGAIFHGAGEDFVGDSRAVPIPCDGEHVSIAAGPCGYVIACIAGGEVHTALAVPPLPR